MKPGEEGNGEIVTTRCFPRSDYSTTSSLRNESSALITSSFSQWVTSNGNVCASSKKSPKLSSRVRDKIPLTRNVYSAYHGEFITIYAENCLRGRMAEGSMVPGGYTLNYDGESNDANVTSLKPRDPVA